MSSGRAPSEGDGVGRPPTRPEAVIAGCDRCWMDAFFAGVELDSAFRQEVQTAVDWLAAALAAIRQVERIPAAEPEPVVSKGGQTAGKFRNWPAEELTDDPRGRAHFRPPNRNRWCRKGGQTARTFRSWPAGGVGSRSERSSAFPAAEPEPVLSKMHHAGTGDARRREARSSIRSGGYGEK